MASTIGHAFIEVGPELNQRMLQQFRLNLKQRLERIERESDLKIGPELVRIAAFKAKVKALLAKHEEQKVELDLQAAQYQQKLRALTAKAAVQDVNTDLKMNEYRRKLNAMTAKAAEQKVDLDLQILEYRAKLRAATSTQAKQEVRAELEALKYRRDLARLTAIKARQPVEADLQEARYRAKLARLTARRQKQEIEANLDRVRYEAQLKALTTRREVQKVRAELDQARYRVELRTLTAKAQIQEVNLELKRLALYRAQLQAATRPVRQRVNIDVDGRGALLAQRTFWQMSQGSRLMRRSISQLRPMLLGTVAAAGLVATSLMHVASSAGLAAGGLMVIPTILGAIGQAGLATVFAMNNIGKAMREFEYLEDLEETGIAPDMMLDRQRAKAHAALMDLDEASRNFVMFIREEYFPAVRELQEGIREAFIVHITPALRHLLQFGEGVARVFELSADSVGRLFGELVQLVTSPAWRRDLWYIGIANVGIFENLARSGFNLLDVIRNIWAAAIPMTETFVRWLQRTTEQLRISAQEARDSGTLREFFSRAGMEAARWGRIIADVFRIIFHTLRAILPLTTEFMSKFERVIDNWARWTASAEGQSKILRFFQAIHDINWRAVGEFALILFGALTAMKIHKSVIDFFRGIVKGGPFLLGLIAAVAVFGALYRTSAEFRDVIHNGLLPALQRLWQSFTNLVKTAAELLGLSWTSFADVAIDAVGVVIRGIDALTAAFDRMRAALGRSNINGDGIAEFASSMIKLIAFFAANYMVVTRMAAAFGAMALAVSRAGGILAAFPHPVGLAIAALVGASLISDDFRDAMVRIMQILEPLIGHVLNTLANVLGHVATALEVVVSVLAVVLDLFAKLPPGIQMVILAVIALGYAWRAALGPIGLALIALTGIYAALSTLDAPARDAYYSIALLQEELRSFELTGRATGQMVRDFDGSMVNLGDRTRHLLNQQTGLPGFANTMLNIFGVVSPGVFLMEQLARRITGLGEANRETEQAWAAFSEALVRNASAGADVEKVMKQVMDQTGLTADELRRVASPELVAVWDSHVRMMDMFRAKLGDTNLDMVGVRDRFTQISEGQPLLAERMLNSAMATEEFRAYAREAGISVEELAQIVGGPAIANADRFRQALDRTNQEIAEFIREGGGLREAGRRIEELAGSYERAGGEMSEFRDVIPHVQEALQRKKEDLDAADRGMRDLRNSTDEAKTAFQEYVQEVRNTTDPLARFNAAQERLAEVQADASSTGFDLAEATGELYAAATDVIGTNPEMIDAILQMGVEAGLSEEQIADMRDALYGARDGALDLIENSDIQLEVQADIDDARADLLEIQKLIGQMVPSYGDSHREPSPGSRNSRNPTIRPNRDGFFGFNDGGFVSGRGTATSDSILARLSDGEFVQRAAAVDYYGKNFMAAINSMSIPKIAFPGFATGGMVLPKFNAGGIVSFRAGGSVLGTSVIQIGVEAATNQDVWDRILRNIDDVNTKVPSLVTVWDNVWSNLRTAWNTFSGFITSQWSGFAGLAQTTFDNVRNRVTEIWDNVWARVRSLWDNFRTWISERWSTFTSFAQDTFQRISDRVHEIWDNAWARVRSLWDNFRTWINERWNTFTTFVRDTFQRINDRIHEIWDNAWARVRSLWDNFRTWINQRWEDFTSFIRDTWTNLKNTITNLWDDLWSTLRTAWNNVESFFTETIPAAFDRAKNAIGSIWSQVQDLVRKPILFVVETVYQNGLRRAWQAIADRVPGVPSLPSAGNAISTLKATPTGFTPPRGGDRFTRFAEGGRVYGPGGPTADRVPAMLSSGEWVINAKAVQEYGHRTMAALNNRELPVPHFAIGGAAKPAPFKPLSFAPGRGSVNEITAWARSVGSNAPVTSSYRSTPDYHGQGLAVDFGGYNQHSLARAAMAMAPYLLELIHQAGGVRYGVKHGKVNPGAYGSLWASGDHSMNHSNHVHIAAQPGFSQGKPVSVSGAFADGILPDISGLFKSIFDGNPIIKTAKRAADGIKDRFPESGIFSEAAGAVGKFLINSVRDAVASKLPTGGGAASGAALVRASGDVMKQAFEQAKSMGASNKVLMALFSAGFVESGFRNLGHLGARNDHDSVGFLQQRPSMGWGSVSQIMNVPHATRSFVSRAMALESQYSDFGRLAQAVQISAFPARYGQRAGDAIAALRRFIPGFSFDSGGLLQPGGTAAVNLTNQPEAVLTGHQWSLMMRIAKNSDKHCVHEEHFYLDGEPVKLIAKKEVAKSNANLARTLDTK